MTHTQTNLRSRKVLGAVLAGGIAAVLASGAAANDSTVMQLAQANTNASEAERKAKQKPQKSPQNPVGAKAQPAKPPKTVQPKPATVKPAPNKPAISSPAKSKPAPVNPVQAKPVKPSPSKPAQAKQPLVKPTPVQPAQIKPPAVKTAPVKPVVKPALPKPVLPENRGPNAAAKAQQNRRDADQRKDVDRPAAQRRVAPKVDSGMPRGFNPVAAAREKRQLQGGPAYTRPVVSWKKIEDVQKLRKKTVQDGGKRVVIREADKRIIVKENNRYIIQNDQSERLRRLNTGAKTRIIRDGYRETVIIRDRVRIVDVTDKYGRIVHRYRVLPGGDRVTIIDNRDYWRREKRRDNYGRDIALGVGAGILIGAAIVALAPPAVAIPRDEYIVDYDRASDDDIYEALSAPPVERLERRYSLEEIRYNDSIRQRMRRVDVDSVTFDFGSWEVGPEQYPALERIARGINRVIEANPDEVFLVEGHTDAVGQEEDNLSLSDRRAQNVAEILSSEFDVPPENLVTQGYGEQFLKVETSEPERRNRRITVRRVTPLMAQDEGDPGDDRQ